MSLAAYRSVMLHGTIVPADALTRAADLSMPGQRSDDYNLTPGLTVNNAVARSWNDLSNAWALTQRLLETAAPEKRNEILRDKWIMPLLRELDYTVAATRGGITLPAGVGDTSPIHYPISHRQTWASPDADPGADPAAGIVCQIVGHHVSLDTKTAGVTARAPHGLVQEFLNRTPVYLYGLITNGSSLRLLRDVSSLAKQTYLEFDLDLMFREGLFGDFRLLWLTLHASRVTPRTLEAAAPDTAPAGPTGGGLPDIDDAEAAGEDALPEAPADLPIGPRADDTWLEQWRTTAIADGTRARDMLELGVAAALTALGTGFLRHPANDQLRAALADTPDADQDLRRTLLKVVYRFIVLFVAEDRDLLLTETATPDARTLYADHLSTARLRQLANTRQGTRHHDLWPAHLLVTDALGSDGLTELGLPALSETLYSRASLGLLATAHISNRWLLEAIRHLSTVTDKRTGQPLRIDYRNLDSEELGGIYEGLLGYVPRHDPDTQSFTLTQAAGSDRKTSGSYYTPTEMITLVLAETLDPLIDTALRGKDPETALLNLTVCDPACGSGHFLVAAARRLAKALATVRTGDPEPSPPDLRAAMRDVVSRCIYGVDLNDLALEVAKVALWLEALTPGKPFAYLDHHLKVGNALLGTTPALLAKNIPDAAFQVLHGDDKDRTSKLKARNKAERKHDEKQQAGQFAFDICTLELPTVQLSQRAHDLDQKPADTIEQIRAAADAWRRLDTDPDLQNARLLHDAWCAAFVQPKPVGEPPYGITHQTLLNIRKDPILLFPDTRQLIENAARQYRFFHWHLEFPSIFTVPDTGSPDSGQGWNGGFSAFLGNPPWEAFKPMDTEFFASAGRADIVGARTAAIRSRMIADLADTDPALSARYWGRIREHMGAVTLLSKGNRFPLTGNGMLATHDLFTEHCRDLTAKHGSSGIIVPTTLMTGAQTAPFVADLLGRQQLGGFYDFTNTAGIFPDVDSRFRFGILRIAGRLRPAHQVRLAFHLTSPTELTPHRMIELTADDLTRINPNTKNLPVFASPTDAKITAAIHQHVPILRRLDDTAGDPWAFLTPANFHMTSDSALFHSAPDLESQGATFDGFAWTIDGRRFLPLHEGKHVWHYDHRFATGKDMPPDKTRAVTETEHTDSRFEIQTRHYVAESEVSRKLSHRTDRLWLMGWRDIASATNQRTLIPALFPRSAVGNTFPLLQPNTPADSIWLLAAMSSLPCDYTIRQKSSGAHVTKGQLNQAPVPHPDTYTQPAPWQPALTLHEWLHPRITELVYTSWNLAPWATDVGDPGAPYRWDPARRLLLQAEIDAAMFHAYYLDRDQTVHILSTFRALRDAETRTHGEYRTERLVLAEYDRLARAITAGGTGYASNLTPAPGDGPRHPSR